MNNELKNQFLNSLNQASLSVHKSEELLSLFQDTDFVDSMLDTAEYKEAKDLWSLDYFRKQCGILKASAFTRKRCEHALVVKRYLQEKKIKGFIVQEDLNPNLDPEAVDLKTSNKVNSDISAMLASNSNLLNRYTPPNNFDEAINNKDIEQIKSILMLYITDSDYSINDALISVLYCYQKVPSIFEEYEESKFKKPVNLDENAWKEEMYLINQQIYLNVNFSLERLLHMINVVTFLNSKTSVSRLVKDTSNSSSSSRVNSSNNQNAQRSKNDNTATIDAETNQQSDFIKKVALIGGAVLAGLILIFTIL